MLACTPALAGRPFITDDAAIVDARACQLENYYRHHAEEREFGAVPACNFTGNLEVSLGPTRSLDGEADSDLVGQLKTVLRPVHSGTWGAALAVGVDDRVAGAQNGVRNAYVNVPLTWSVRDRLKVSVNVGAEHDRVEQQTRATYGLLADAQSTERLGLVGEIFGNDRERASWQTGLRFAIIPAHVELIGSLGAPFGQWAEGRFWNVVVRLVTAPLW